MDKNDKNPNRMNGFNFKSLLILLGFLLGVLLIVGLGFISGNIVSGKVRPETNETVIALAEVEKLTLLLFILQMPIALFYIIAGRRIHAFLKEKGQKPNKEVVYLSLASFLVLVVTCLILFHGLWFNSLNTLEQNTIATFGGAIFVAMGIWEALRFWAISKKVGGLPKRLLGMHLFANFAYRIITTLLFVGGLFVLRHFI